jgi:hypothetical protein
MTTWKYADQSRRIVISDDGRQSCLASVLPEGTPIADPDPIPVDQRITDAWSKADAIAKSGADDNSRARYLTWMIDPASSAERKARIAAVTAWMDAIWTAYAAFKANPVGEFTPPEDPCPFTFWQIAEA